jgi:valyl-tRNA synthetase
VRDHEGRKMSKTNHNNQDPLDLIDGIDLDGLIAKRTEALLQPESKAAIEAATRTEFPDGIRAFGTDALRLSFASLATMGRDVRFDTGRIDGYHKFCNKLWNASQYVFGKIDGGTEHSQAQYSPADLWIRSRLADCIAQVHAGYATYRFDLITQSLQEFAWHEFCDWYLELTKPVLNSETSSAAVKAGALKTLSEVLDALFRLLHPLIPFITEELWLELARREQREASTLMLARFPEIEDFERDPEAEAEIEWLKAFIVGIRQIRGEMNISPSLRLPVLLAQAAASDVRRAERYRSYIEWLARVASIETVSEDERPQIAATALLGELSILVPLEGVVDISREIERLDKQLTKLTKDLEQCRGKLANERFTANAPIDIVAAERSRIEDLAGQQSKLAGQLAQLRGLKL